MNCNWWHTRPLWNHSRSPLASAVACFPLQMPSRKRWKGGEDMCHWLPLRKDSFAPCSFIWGSPFCWACDFMKTSSHFQLFQFTFLTDNLSKLFCWIIVHGLTDSLHSTGDLNNSAREIYQWCTPAAGGGGGEDIWALNHLENGVKNTEPHLSKFRVHTADFHYSLLCSMMLLQTLH